MAEISRRGSSTQNWVSYRSTPARYSWRSGIEPMQLLVSVRSAEEAEAALAGGAGLIDVKEPARGSLGAADPTVIAEVLHAVGGRAPVSAALGELLDAPMELPRSELSFVKWGLSGAQGKDWRAA